jgi:POT family proton-dependent oligopeptide transporter
MMVAIFFYIIAKSGESERRGLIALVILIAFLMLFCALEMQLGSLINLFSQRNINNEIFGYSVPASLSQAINPLSIIVFGAIFARFMKFSKKNATMKFTFGIFTMAICFFVLYMGCLAANEYGKVSYIYLLVSISFMGIGELCIAPLVFEQATNLAPKHLKGLVMGMVMLSLAFANLAGIIISKFMSIPKVGGAVDSLVSLEIYREGFLNIAFFNVGLTILFLLFYRFVNKVIVGR